MTVAAFVAFLSLWFVLSVFNQLLGRRVPALQRWDLLQLLPLWNFFAPRPGVTDYYLVYRDKDDAGHLGPWRLVVPAERRRWTSFHWKPHKLGRKVLSDVVQAHAGYQHAADPSVMLSVPYLTCLRMALEAGALGDNHVRQFVLAQKKGLIATDTLMPILVSDFHTS